VLSNLSAGGRLCFQALSKARASTAASEVSCHDLASSQYISDGGDDEVLRRVGETIKDEGQSCIGYLVY
jgi:hypothetical protein